MTLFKKKVNGSFFLFLTLGIFALSLANPSDALAWPKRKKKSSLYEVDVLRKERKAKMPYLDTGFIDDEISSDKIKEKAAFLAGEEKTLNDLIQRSIVMHTPARAARERISLARRRILASLRALFPEAALEYNEKEGSLSGDGYSSKNYRFKFRQPIFRGGILWNTLLQEKAGLEAAEKEYIATTNDLVNDVSAAYFEYNRAQQVVTGQDIVVGQMQRYADISEQKYTEGIVSEIERLNVQSLYSQMKYDFETSKQELELAKLEIQKYLGLELDESISVNSLYRVEDMLPGEESGEAGGEAIRMPEEFQEPKEIPGLPALVDMSYMNRAELQVEAAKLESARLEERIKWGKMIPQADAVLEFGKLGEAFNSVTTAPGLRQEFRFMLEFNWNAGGNKLGYTFENDARAPSVSQFQGGSGSQTGRNTLSLGLLDGLQDFADAKEAEVAKLDQITQLEKIEKEVVQDVKQSYFDFQKARIQVQSSLQRVDYRRRLVLLSKHKLEKNEIQISEYLQSEIDHLQELATLHKALSDYFTAKAKLNRAVGIRDFFPIEAWYGRITRAA